MSVNWSQYSLEQLRAHATQTFREGGGSRPDVLLIEIDGHKAVLKDQSAADKVFALLIGPILNWRECKALTKLSNVSCVPKLLSKPTSRSFLMTYHRSEQLTRLINFEPEWPEFFDKLKAAIDQIHQAGVAHNDLRNPTNTLVTPNGDPILVDLVACFCRGRAWNLPNQWMFSKFTQVDLSAITKMKSKVAKELISDNDIVAEDIAGRPGMAVKALGKLIRRTSRRLFTK
jgi:serine/threonine protein kinase